MIKWATQLKALSREIMSEDFVEAGVKHKEHSLQRWERLSACVNGGKLNIDSNSVESSIRPVALGRKNYLFAGSHEAAKRSGMLYSLLGTCKMNDIEPYAG